MELGGHHRPFGLTGPWGPFARPYGTNLLPAGEQVHGVNLTIEPGTTGSWGNLWKTWRWDEWIKPQVDAAASIGANTVRIIGTYDAIHDGTLTQATYHTRQQQLAAYVNSLGMAYYPCAGGHISDVIDRAPFYTNDFIIGQATDLLAALDGHDIIGLDVVQENRAWAAQTERGGAVMQAIREAHPGVPLTYSWHSPSTDSTAYRADQVHALDRYVDFHDIHVYDDVAADYLDFHWDETDKPLLIGEFGQNLAAGQPAQESRYSSVKGLLDHSAPGGQRLAGSLAWAITDQQSVDAGKWGLFDASFVERTYLTGVFATFPAV